MSNSPVIFTARCPECNGTAEWQAIPVLTKTDLPGDYKHITPEYVITCKSCKGGSL